MRIIIDAKSFTSLTKENYSSVKFHTSNSGKRAVAIKTSIDGGGEANLNQICVNNEMYSGFILMIY